MPLIRSLGLALLFSAGVPTVSVAAERVLGMGACATGAPFAGRVAAILDGATLRLAGGQVVRLAGIEAPMRPLGHAGPWPLAEEARARLSALVAGQVVALTPVGARTDRHGRTHAIVKSPDGRTVQALMVAAGLARIHGLAAERDCLPGLYDAERQARGQKRGLWAHESYAILAADVSSLDSQIGLYVLAEGRVVSVGRGRSVTFLDFGRNWRRDFTVMVPNAVARRLADAGTPLEGLVKRRIRVRGVLDESSGPAMRIESANAIELLGE